MGEATRDEYNPAYNHLVKLLEECNEKQAPDFVISGIQKALRLIEDRDIYCETITAPPSEALNNISDATRNHNWEELYQQGSTSCHLEPVMLTGKLEGQFLQSIVSMNKAKKVLDLGMYTGYSALACAEALPDDGCVISCELEPYLENFARNLFAKSPHGKKIQIHMGAAEETLLQLAKENQSFDVIFIDTHKDGYKNVYQMILERGLLSEGGTIVFDNALFYGEPYSKDCNQETMPDGWGVKSCNEFIAADERVHAVLVPVRDGLLIVRRKKDMYL